MLLLLTLQARDGIRIYNNMWPKTDDPRYRQRHILAAQHPLPEGRAFWLDFKGQHRAVVLVKMRVSNSPDVLTDIGQHFDAYQL